MSLTITRSIENRVYDDGHGRDAIVVSSSGQHFLISEVHRKIVSPLLAVGITEINEAMVFKCDKEGDILSYDGVYRGSTIEDVLLNFQG
jgi:hypothetical protein